MQPQRNYKVESAFPFNQLPLKWFNTCSYLLRKKRRKGRKEGGREEGREGGRKGGRKVRGRGQNRKETSNRLN